MNNPITITEPRSFADSLADIRFLQQRVDTATKALLTRHGWRYTRLTRRIAGFGPRNSQVVAPSSPTSTPPWPSKLHSRANLSLPPLP